MEVRGSERAPLAETIDAPVVTDARKNDLLKDARRGVLRGRLAADCRRSRRGSPKRVTRHVSEKMFDESARQPCGRIRDEGRRKE